MGTFAEHFAVWAPALVKIPDSLGDHEAPLACGGLTAYGAVKKLLAHHVLPGRPIAIIGAAGGLGHYAVQIATAFGYQVIGVDIGAERLDFVKSLGAEMALERRRGARRRARASSAASTPASCSRRAWPASASASTCSGSHGLFVAVGLPATSEGNLEFNPFELFAKDADDHLLRGRHRAGHARAGRPRRGRQGARATCRAPGRLSELGDIFDELEASKYLGRAVLTDLAH